MIIVVQESVSGYQPKPEDLEYPNKLRKLDSLSSTLSEEGENASGPEIADGRENGNGLPKDTSAIQVSQSWNQLVYMIYKPF